MLTLTLKPEAALLRLHHRSQFRGGVSRTPSRKDERERIESKRISYVPHIIERQALDCLLLFTIVYTFESFESHFGALDGFQSARLALALRTV